MCENKKKKGLGVPNQPILVVDDLKTTITVITDVLYKAGYDNVISCSDSRMVMDYFYKYDIEVVLLDLKMPYLDGESLLQTIKQRFPEIPVIIVTGKTEVAVHCMKAGAFDYIITALPHYRHYPLPGSDHVSITPLPVTGVGPC